MLIIALTGMSGVGKSHIAQLLSEQFRYRHLRFSDKLKEMYPDDGEWIMAGYETYKHLLCEMAESINIKEPDLFIDDLLKRLYSTDESAVIDDLRTPRQLSALNRFCSDFGHELIVIRVYSNRGKVVSFMDTFCIESDHIIDNSTHLSDSQIIQHISRAIHKSKGV